MRLGHEVPGLKGLKRQAKCYLAAMNALRLVDSSYAWILKPVSKTKQMVSTAFIEMFYAEISKFFQ